MEQMTNQFNYLRTLERYPQKSAKWFAQRKNTLTASSVGSAINCNIFSPLYKFLIEKITAKEFNHNENCYRGNKFEEICRMIYELDNNVQVAEFGLIFHPTIPYLAASPDGIISQYRKDGTCAETVGRMVEIKCPNKITKTGKPFTDICKPYYYAQVQVQLECCNLEECDFSQYQFKEYSSYEEYLQDYDPETNRSKTTGMRMGLLLQLVPKDKHHLTEDRESEEYNKTVWNTDHGKHVYPPSLDMTAPEMKEWADMLINSPEKLQEYIVSNTQYEQQYISEHPEETTIGMSNHVFDTIKYWCLIDTHTLLIKRNRDWFKTNFTLMEETWDILNWLKDPVNCIKKVIFVNYVAVLQKCFPQNTPANQARCNKMAMTQLRLLRSDNPDDGSKVIKEMNLLKETYKDLFDV
jgi:putative phage-type endonuclease